MNKTLTNKHLHALKSGVTIFAPICLYSLLKTIEIGKTEHGKKTDEIINKLAGIPLVDWPKDTKDDYYELSETLFSLEELQEVFAEIHYFLIYIITGYISKYIDQKNQKLVLDALFDLFSDKQTWENKYPEDDAFTKYRESENSLLEFSNQIAKSTRMTDAMTLFDYSTDITSINKFFIQPALDKIFSVKD